jgi:hypothetical protein
MKNLNPDKKIIYILNKYGYKKDAKTSRVSSNTDYYRKGSIENNDLEIVAVRRYDLFKCFEDRIYWQEIIMVTFDNCYLMDVGKAALIWKGSYNWVDCCKDYFNVETMAWDISAKYREIIENISTRLYKLKEERK